MMALASPRFDPQTVEAVVFDIGGVFTYPDWERPSSMLAQMDLPPVSDPEEFRRAHHAGVAALSAAERPTEEHRQDFWTIYDHAYGVTLGVPAELLDRFSQSIRGTWGWLHHQNIAEFHLLAATGIPLAIVSNNDGTAPQQMRDYGVCWVRPDAGLPVVKAIVDSALVGVAKPDPAIMAPALTAIGLPPELVLYVGDTAHADIVGATNAGMQSVQLDPFDHHTHYSHARLPDLAALNGLLF